MNLDVFQEQMKEAIADLREKMTRSPHSVRRTKILDCARKRIMRIAKEAKHALDEREAGPRWRTSPRWTRWVFRNRARTTLHDKLDGLTLWANGQIDDIAGSVQQEHTR